MPFSFPFSDLLDAEKVYAWFAQIFWPHGTVCPRCGERNKLHVHSRRRAPLLDWHCQNCGRIFNVFTHTVFKGTHHDLLRLFAIVRGVAQGTPTNQLCSELGCAYKELLGLRHKLQGFISEVTSKEPPLQGVVEIDEMYQNAGEKRRGAPRPERSAATAREQTARPRLVGNRSSTGGRSGRSR